MIADPKVLDEMLEALKAFRGFREIDSSARLKMIEEQADGAIARVEGV